MHDHAVGETAAAHEAEDAVARLPAEHLCAADRDRPGDLQPGNVLRAAGRRGRGTLALREVGRVETRVRDAHEKLLTSGHGVGALLQTDHLIVAGSGENHCAHVCSLGRISAAA
jgi:hypothetical protein